MKEEPSHLPIIASVLPEDKRRALALVFSYLNPKERDEQIETVLNSPPAGDDALAGLLGAFRRNDLVGAIFAQIQPGKTAQAWFPRLADSEPASTAVQLLQAIVSWLKQDHVELAQMLFEQISAEEETLLIQGGYSYLTDLLYLACLPEEFPNILPSSTLEFVPYKTGQRGLLKNLVAATYQNSLDCPKLNDVRDMEAVLLGYQSCGVYRPELWSVIFYEGQAVGCLLLADHPEFDNVELMYMGVTSAWRGRGWGMEIVRFAQWQTRCLGRARLVLAVDASNRPGIQMYSAVGFQAWDRRRVYYWKGEGDVKSLKEEGRRRNS